VGILDKRRRRIHEIRIMLARVARSLHLYMHNDDGMARVHIVVINDEGMGWRTGC